MGSLTQRRLASSAGALTAALSVLAVTSLVACFESGPLDSGGAVDSGLGADDSAVGVERDSERADLETGHDTEPLLDSGPEPDTASASDSSVMDTALDDTAGEDTSTGPPCLTVSDCSALTAPDDKCVGRVACVDYQCVVEPVLCPDTGDPCAVNRCDPLTGACVISDVCACAPVGELLCGQQIDYSTDELGATQVLTDYGCPTAVGAGLGAERVFTFLAASDQRVRVEASSEGVESLWVIGWDGTICEPATCLAGGASVAAFDAVAGTGYAIVVEQTAAGGVVSLTAECGVNVEDRCHDGVDDDGDGATDCVDSDCGAADGCGAVEIDCNDHIDNEPDGKTDCADEDCKPYLPCTPVEQDCGDGIDNDGDGATDCADSSCVGSAGCTGPRETNCTDRIDNELDGKTDCADEDCKPNLPCTPVEWACADGFDNDGDGLTDCFDADCSSDPSCTGPPQSEALACFDGIDNEPDGKTDCADEDCWGEPQCLQACDINGLTIHYCNHSYGMATGGGDAAMTNYSCNPTPMPGKEVVYPFLPEASGPVTVTMSSGASPLALYLLVDQGQGCAARYCQAYGPHQITFTAIANTHYYFVIDGPAGVDGNFQIRVDCDL